MKHFKLTSNTKVNKFGITLFQVELTIDCRFGKAGDLGGWVEKEENLQGENAWIGIKAEVFLKGEISGGEIMGGEICGGEIWGGEIWGGEIMGGEISGGVIRGGVIRGGVIWGGVIWGGVICGGEICGGEIWGGVIRGGVIEKSPLQFQGSRHFAIVFKPGYLKIGCVEMTFNDWKKELSKKEVGKAKGYTEQEMIEYTMFVKIVLKFGNDCFKKDENGKCIQTN